MVCLLVCLWGAFLWASLRPHNPPRIQAELAGLAQRRNATAQPWLETARSSPTHHTLALHATAVTLPATSEATGAPALVWAPGLPSSLAAPFLVQLFDGDGAFGLVVLPDGAPELSVFEVLPGAEERSGFFALRMTNTGTFLGVEPDGIVVADKVTPRSMEHFAITRLDGGFAQISPQGSPGRCLGPAPWGLVARDCTASDARLRVRNAVRNTAAVRIPAPTPFPRGTVIIATTARALRKAPQTIAVMRSWTAVPDSKVVVCVEDAADAFSLRQKLPAATALTDCEAHEVGHHRIPTYRGIFAAAERLSESDSDVIVFANADVLFPPTHLRQLVDAMVSMRARTPFPHVFATGRRRNCDPPSRRVEDPMEDIAAWLAQNSTHPFDTLRSRCALFGDDAQDYFAATKGAFSWDTAVQWNNTAAVPMDRVVHGRPFKSLVAVPPLVVGGIAFDNFIVSQANKRPDMLSIDATAAMDVFHINHGVDVRASHHKPSSLFNSKLAHESGGWAHGKTSVADYSAVPDGEAVSVVVRRQLRRVMKDDALVVKPLFHTDEAATDPPDAFSRPWQRPD